jgi:hypothetical protein
LVAFLLDFAMLGLKLFSDTSRSRADEIINRAVRDRLGLEVLLADDKGVSHPATALAPLLAETPFSQIPHKVLHLGHKSEGHKIVDPLVRELVLSELRDMRYLGINRAVLPYHHDLPVMQRDNVSLLKSLVPLNEVAESHGVTFYVKNTSFKRDPANPEIYRRMFEQALNYELGHLGFCFDIGCAKVFSDKPLREWLQLLDWLSGNKVPLHFHLYNNDGANNQHLSFRQSDKPGYNTGDRFTSGTHYLVVVSELLNRYPGIKVLDTPDQEVLPGLDWLQQVLRRR